MSLSIATSLYERYLLGQILKEPEKVPKHVSLVLSESDLLHADGFTRLRDYIQWCRQMGIRITSIYIDVLDTEEKLRWEMIEKLLAMLDTMLKKLPEGIGFEVYTGEGELHSKQDGEKLLVYFSVGFGGRKEVTKAMISLLSDVKEGKLEPNDITEQDIESRLKVKHEPDIFIRSGGKHLSDFLIWQAVYSELYFSEVNWHKIRKMDIIRIIRDFQKRQRRFGK
ncbi:undecaprenyl diphosphate synthase family protein [Methanolobus sp. ZRKC3]|uniref:undecaprenyl diphosphate synthase family protein n=1 Tax=Methanolobus sp. ZRKC3 TaxID=3125786 RepID=UPI003251A8A3